MQILSWKKRELLITTCNVVLREFLRMFLTVSYLAIKLIYKNEDMRGKSTKSRLTPYNDITDKY